MKLESVMSLRLELQLGLGHELRLRSGLKQVEFEVKVGIGDTLGLRLELRSMLGLVLL